MLGRYASSLRHERILQSLGRSTGTSPQTPLSDTLNVKSRPEGGETVQAGAILGVPADSCSVHRADTVPRT